MSFYLCQGIIALKRKVNVLELEQRYSDIPPVAQMMIDILADYEQHPDEFHDDSYREVTEEQRPGYIGVYRAKTYLYMAHAYAKISEESAAAAQKARQYLALYEQTDFAKTMNDREEISSCRVSRQRSFPRCRSSFPCWAPSPSFPWQDSRSTS